MDIKFYPTARWEVVIASVFEWEEDTFRSDSMYDAMLDVLWGFRFREASSVSVFDVRTNKRVALFEHERDAVAFFKKKWPNCSDFVWANRHEKSKPAYFAEELDDEEDDDLFAGTQVVVVPN